MTKKKIGFPQESFSILKPSRKEKIEMITRPIMIATFGALLLLNTLLIGWTISNFDLFTKCIKYPEAVRELQIEVRIVSPNANQ